MTNDTWIEVTGAGACDERLTLHRVALTLNVRDARGPGLARQAEQLRERVLSALLAAGLQRDELSEGGAELTAWTSWWQRKKKHQVAHEDVSHRVLIACPDLSRIRAALNGLEGCFLDARYSLDVSNQSPNFECHDEDRAQALQQAVRDAREKAQTIANATGTTLGRVLQVEELSAERRGSGAYGDRGNERTMYSLSEPDTDELTDLDAAKRRIQFTYLFRFATNA